MRICLISSEFAPYAKAGGLGDAVGALASRLHRHGHDVRVFIPLYSSIDRQQAGLVPVEFLQDIKLSTAGFGLRYSVQTGCQVDGLWVYFIDCPLLYSRPG
ncbi:MAG: glycogen/starch synthase, partial [Gammaproteobacteria bacterium]|nr:glycogen/starch synthase [Gammaproteobacteria bacterium]